MFTIEVDVDIVSDITSEIRLFADDCILYRAIKDPSDSAALQTDNDTLFSWSDIWQMNFNSSKCHNLSIGRHRNKIIPSYVLGSTTL